MESPLLKAFEQAGPQLCFLHEIHELVKSYSPNSEETPIEFIQHLIKEYSSDATMVTDLKVLLMHLEKTQH